MPMGFLFGIVRAILTVFAIAIAILVVVDGSLLANLLRKRD